MIPPNNEVCPEHGWTITTHCPFCVSLDSLWPKRRRPTLPPIEAEGWESMSESLFRDLVTMDMIVSPKAAEVIKRRAAQLGIEV